LGDFMPVNGDVRRRVNAYRHLFAGNAEDLQRNAERRKDNLLFHSTRKNEHRRASFAGSSLANRPWHMSFIAIQVPVGCRARRHRGSMMNERGVVVSGCQPYV
jgi:hypothetical protein